MNYIELMNQFWLARRGKRITSTQADLYFCLLQESNERKWENPFAFSNVQICARIGISEPTLIDARSKLKQIGLIDFEPGERKLSSPRYKILYLNNLSIRLGKDRVETGQKKAEVSEWSYFNPILQKTETEMKEEEAVSISIDSVPNDGKNRNFTGLMRKMEELNCSSQGRQRMILLSNYGEIGNPIWKLFCEIDKGGIKMPERFILSRLSP